MGLCVCLSACVLDTVKGGKIKYTGFSSVMQRLQKDSQPKIEIIGESFT